MAKTPGVSLHPWKRVLCLLAAASVTSLACTKNPEVAASDKAASPAPAAASPTPAAPAPKAPPAATGSPLAGIPGMDFSALPPSAQQELATIFSDEFCYCGCPHTVGACLKTHTCKHARRMAKLAALYVSSGVPATETIVSMSRYYAAFREPRKDLKKVDPRLCRGSPNAPVTLVEFADFECPSCGRAHPVLEKFAQQNPTQVRFCFAPFPLPNHPNALPAGQAALWARDQGKFWEMHDALFAQQENLAPAALVALADKLGLPGAKLQEAIKSGAYLQELEAFRGMGRAAGIQGTPSLFFNGRSYEMGLDEELLAHSLEDEVEWHTNNNAWAAD